MCNIFDSSVLEIATWRLETWRLGDCGENVETIQDDHNFGKSQDAGKHAKRTQEQSCIASRRETQRVEWPSYDKIRQLPKN